MLTKQHIMTAIASVICIAGGVGAAESDMTAETGLLRIAQAASDDISREDRQEDRRQDDGVGARVTLPRSADGSVDVAALLSTLDARFDAGAREIQIRDDSLAKQEARDLLLALARDQNLLRQIADVMPAGGGEATVRLRGVVDARIQRKPDGSLRLRVEDINFNNMSAVQRAELAQQLVQQTGFDRVRIQGIDADGKRVRTEFRSDGGLVADVMQGSGNLAKPAEAGPSQSGARQQREDRQSERQLDRPGNRPDDRRGDGVSSADRPQRMERAEKAERPENVERSERVERPDKVERAERVERPEKVERSERVERPEKVERPDKVEMVEKVDRPDRSHSGKGR